MADRHSARRPLFLLASVLLLTACASTDSRPLADARPAPEAAPVALTATATSADDTPASAARARDATAAGRIVEAPSNIRAFSPEESADVITDASNVSLRGIFESLGEDAATWYQHVQTLSDPYFEGRAAGTKGFERATEYLGFHFERIGLEPAFPAEDDAASDAWTSYAQPFTYDGRPRRTYTMTGESFVLGGRTYEHGTDYVVLAPSGGDSVSAPVTFVGYGLAEGQDGYASFDDDTDLSGRIALLLRYEPLDDEGRSRWSDRRFSPFASLTRKLEAVVERGAAGIILVNPPGAVDGATGLETLQRSGRFASSLDLPVVQVTPEVADALLEEADPEGRTLAAMRRLADEGAVRSVDLAEDALVTISGHVDVQVDREQFPSANAGAVLRGRGQLTDEWIVIGGHYDHVGYGRSGAMPGAAGQLHPGADDNASGTAGVLVLAERMKAYYDEAAPDADLRSVLFMGFGAEEAGLNGSAHYVNHPTVPLDQVTLMVNMDMIGRLRNDELMVGGSGTATELDGMLERYGRASGLTLALSPSGRGPSDHTNFYNHEIPVLFMFTGLHDEYHRPGDKGHTVNPAGAIRVLDLIELIAEDAATRPQRLTFQASEGIAARGGPSRTGARVRLGIMPSYSAELETGVLVDSVADGTSAAEGGVQRGDVLVTWNGEELTGGRRMAELLRESEPGDTVKLGLLRDGRRIEVEITLQARETGD